MAILSIPGKVRVKMFISDKKLQGNYTGEAGSDNVRKDLDSLKKKARLSAYYNFMKDGGKIRTKITDEVKTYKQGNFGDFSPKFNQIEKDSVNEIHILDYKIIYFGTKKYLKNLGKDKQTVKEKTKIRVKRENWNGKYIEVARFVSGVDNKGRSKKGRIASYKKWSQKKSEKLKDKI